jgi:hypothetical protein
VKGFLLRCAACALIAALPVAASAQDVHAGAQGYVFETEVRERTGDGVIRLENGASMLATPELAGARSGAYAVVVPLRSGCRVWIADVGLSRCSLVQEMPDDAPRTDVVLVWVERVIDAGATILLAGGSVFTVEDVQATRVR